MAYQALPSKAQITLLMSDNDHVPEERTQARRGAVTSSLSQHPCSNLPAIRFTIEVAA